MKTSEFESIDLVIDRIRRHPMLADIQRETLIDYIVDFTHIVNCGGFYDVEHIIADIEDYKVELPFNFVGIEYITNINGTRLEVKDSSVRFDNYAIPTKYLLKGRVLIFDSERGEVNITYKCIPVDEDGYPMISNNTNFLRALESYVKVNYFTVLFDLGKINRAVLEQAHQDYAWNVGSAMSAQNRISVDEMNKIANTINTLIEDRLLHKKNYKTIDSTHDIKVH